MEHFICRENIRRYRQLLDQATDEQKRNVIHKLLAEEEAQERRSWLRPDNQDKQMGGQCILLRSH